jgi:hypothetical protein
MAGSGMQLLGMSVVGSLEGVKLGRVWRNETRNMRMLTIFFGRNHQMVIWEKKLGELHHPHPNPVASLHGSRFIAFCSSNFVDEL